MYKRQGIFSAAASSIKFDEILAKPLQVDMLGIILTSVIAILLTAVPLVVEPVNKMWHTGNYMAFPARYGYRIYPLNKRPARRS